MRQTFINEPEDMQWLIKTNLGGNFDKFSQFHAAILYGNEDSPCSVDLFYDEEPNVYDEFVTINFL